MRNGPAGAAAPIVSIIVVNYNAGTLLRECIGSLLRHVTVPCEIIVYDNDSNDDSLAQAGAVAGTGSVRIIRGDANIGFAPANNIAARQAQGRLLHFLNPDIIVNARLDDDYRSILAAAGDWIAVTSLVDPEGRPQNTTHLIPTRGNYLRRIVLPGRAKYWSIGASIIMPAATFRLIGGWPEDYFMYAEDLDLFYQAYRRGVAVSYCDTRLVHIGRGSTSSCWDDAQRALRIERSYRQFYRKHGMTANYYFVRMMQMAYMAFYDRRALAITLQAFITTLHDRRPEGAGVWP